MPRNLFRSFLLRRGRQIDELGLLGGRRAFEIVSEVFQSSVQQGRVELLQHDQPGGAGRTVRIVPSARGAAAMELAVDGVVLSVALGPQRHVCEISLRDPEWDGVLRAILEAVAQGRYEESVGRGLMGQTLVMSFETDAGRIEVKHVNLVDPPDEPESSRRYAPY